MHVNNANSIAEINHNLYFTSSSPLVFYNGQNRATLADLQSTNIPSGNDTNSVSGNPLFLSSTFLYPQNPLLSNAGKVFSRVSEDITGVIRATPPDIGAYEFSPLNADIELIAGGRKDAVCFTSNDSIFATITNLMGVPIQLTGNPITVNWQITGASTSSGSISFSSGIFNVEDTITAYFSGVDFSAHGTHFLSMHIDSNSFNSVTSNDSLQGIEIKRVPDLIVRPRNHRILNNQDSVQLFANSRFFPIPEIYISEIVHGRASANGFPIGAWPNYLLAQNYIEITGPPGTDLGGITLEQWNVSSMLSSYTFPQGTILSPEGTAVIAVGGMNTSIPVPKEYYYHGQGEFNFIFLGNSITGRILRSVTGSIIDATWYGGLSFPTAAGVAPSDWSGNIPTTSNVGVKLSGPYTKNASNWIEISNSNPATPNQINPGISNPPQYGPLPGLNWTLNSIFHDDNPITWVGPFNNIGIQEVIVSYPTPCGLIEDTIYIEVEFLVCDVPDSIVVIPACTTATVSWNSGNTSYSHNIEYGISGFTPGTGTLIQGITSPHTITGLLPATNYDLYIIDSCGQYFSSVFSYDSTHSGLIQSERNSIATTSTMSSCPGLLSVETPIGSVIDSISVDYSITANTGMFISGSRSYLRCLSPGGVAESDIFMGSPTNHPGTGIYHRSGLTIANGVTGGGTINFELHNFRNESGTGCLAGISDVDPNSFKISIYTTDSVFDTDYQVSQNIGFSTINFPNASGFTVSHNGAGTYTFIADSNVIGFLSWDFGDGNTATGDSVVHQYATEGTYTVSLIAENTCGLDSVTNQINYISIKNFDLSNIQLYPNPSKDVVKISGIPKGGVTRFKLHDMKGRIVMDFEVSGDKSDIEIHLENLKSGVYFLIVSNERVQITKPLISVGL